MLVVNAGGVLAALVGLVRSDADEVNASIPALATIDHLFVLDSILNTGKAGFDVADVLAMMKSSSAV